MIETASIALALVATVGAVAVYVLMRRELKRSDQQGYEQYRRAEKLFGQAAIWEKTCDWWRATALAKMGEIAAAKKAASERTAKGNRTKARRRKEVQDATTSKLARIAPTQTDRAAA